MTTWAKAGAAVTAIVLAGAIFATADRKFPGWRGARVDKLLGAATQQLQGASFAVVVPALGELETAKSTPISVPNVRTGGLKVFWIVKDGTRVKKGDLVVEFDASELLLQLQETDGNLEATLRQMEASLIRGNADQGGIATDLSIAQMEHEKALHQAPKDPLLFSRNQMLEGEMNIDLAQTRVREFSGKSSTSKDIGATAGRILLIDKTAARYEEGRPAAEPGLTQGGRAS